MNPSQNSSATESSFYKTGSYQQRQTFQDKDIANDVLFTIKSISNGLNLYTHEASNQAIYQEIQSMLNETNQLQRELFNLMNRKGWYQVEPAPTQNVQQLYQQASEQVTQLPFSMNQRLQ